MVEVRTNADMGQENNVTDQHQAPNLTAIKDRQQKTWTSGDYARIGNTLVIIGELLCEAVDVRAGDKVLDVATGSGNTAISAARRFCEATGIDYVPELIEHARKRAEVEGLEITFGVGDAEDLPYPDASFDVVLSTLGVMFAPNQEKVAEELLRELLGEGVASREVRRRSYVWRYPSAGHFVEHFRLYYGPTLKAFESLDPDGQEALAKDLEKLLECWNISGDATLIVPSDYLEVVAVRR